MLNGYDIIECVCPVCEVIHKQMLSTEYVNNPDAWRKDGKFIVPCKNCKVALKIKDDN